MRFIRHLAPTSGSRYCYGTSSQRVELLCLRLPGTYDRTREDDKLRLPIQGAEDSWQHNKNISTIPELQRIIVVILCSESFIPPKNIHISAIVANQPGDLSFRDNVNLWRLHEAPSKGTPHIRPLYPFPFVGPTLPEVSEGQPYTYTVCHRELLSCTCNHGVTV